MAVPPPEYYDGSKFIDFEKVGKKEAVLFSSNPRVYETDIQLQVMTDDNKPAFEYTFADFDATTQVNFSLAFNENEEPILLVESEATDRIGRSYHGLVNLRYMNGYIAEKLGKQEIPFENKLEYFSSDVQTTKNQYESAPINYPRVLVAELTGVHQLR